MKTMALLLIEDCIIVAGATNSGNQLKQFGTFRARNFQAEVNDVLALKTVSYPF